MELVGFLRARLDEDEQVARASEQRPWLHASTAPPSGWVYVESGRDAVHEVARVRVAGNAEHIARHDPARVLREVEVKRQLLEAVEEYLHDHEDGPDPMSAITLRLLALPYANHPDYDESWRP